MSRISVRGAKENNLKEIDVEIPHGKLTVITGISGSGKSSLVRDVLQREGQRMYLETFSAYTRSRLGKIRPAKITGIDGMLPVISVGQTDIQANRRSTAGTFSDIAPLLRQLFARYNDQGLPLLRNRFSFNSDKGWCCHCKGLGIEEYIDLEKLVGNPEKSLRDGALVITLPNGYTIYSQVTIDELDRVCRSEGFSVDDPWKDLTDRQRKVILYGSKRVKVLYGKHSLESRMRWSGMTARPREEAYYRGIIPVMEDILKRDRNDNILRFVSSRVCSVCNGRRLSEESLAVTWKGKNYSYYDLLPFEELKSELENSTNLRSGEAELVDELKNRLARLCGLSVGHIAAGRLSETLSQGELRRMRLAQLNSSGLTGVLYLFDEPSIGLHPRDVAMLIESLYGLVEHGNTVVVVEHNEQLIKAAQHIIELGPGAGSKGGELIYSGTIDRLLSGKIDTPTGKMLSSVFSFDSVSGNGDKPQTFEIAISKKHNIVNQRFTFARERLNVIVGVSGAGKSTLVSGGLASCKEFKRVVHIDQRPIGRTSRSNPATYTGMFDHIRKLFAATPLAREKGFTAAHFSFNSKQGQCPACKGTGTSVIGMHIFDDIVQVCSVCRGTRYKSDILTVTYRGKNIHEVLQLTVSDALGFFDSESAPYLYLKALNQLGLGYLHLGQSSTTLSGGEAQRIKLASSLYDSANTGLLYILDEPTTGLHAADIARLVDALREIIARGNTVVVVEHDKQVIAMADWIVDIGPEGGNRGGKRLFAGALYDFLTNHTSPTVRELAVSNRFTLTHPVSKKPEIALAGIRTNNLTGFDLDIPAGQVVVFTGRSGSGKSSLLLHTLHAEGQRLFTENLSSFRRLQLKLQRGAVVDTVIGMMPTVAVEAEPAYPDIRATVASISGIYDLLRLLFSRYAVGNSDQRYTAADFSLSNENSVCPACEGSGFEKICKPDSLLANRRKGVFDGALINHKTVSYFLDQRNKYRSILIAMAKNRGINLSKPWNELGDEERELILFGTGSVEYSVEWEYKRKNNVGIHEFTDVWEGLCRLIEKEYRIHYPSVRGKNALSLLSDIPCSVCNGNRLKPELLNATFAGKNIAQTVALPVEFLLREVKSHSYGAISDALRRQLAEKLSFLNSAGMGAVPLNRPARWLSFGELKWIRLCSILSLQLSGITIILDEPSSGLDSRARLHLVNIIEEAKQRGNTILIGDHRPELVGIADRVIELGPESGSSGGTICFDGKPSEINEHGAPVTFQILSGGNTLPLYPENKSVKPLAFISVTKLYPQTVNPIIGPLGCGKTRLLRAIERECRNRSEWNVWVVSADTPGGGAGSVVATRLGVWNDVRRAFARTDKAVTNGLTASEFGFNSSKAQCPVCKGRGRITVKLDLLPDVTEICPECNGMRYRPEWLDYRLEGKNPYEWLQLTVGDVRNSNIWSAKSKRIILSMIEAGLGYPTLGQEIDTLSLGERRRLALAQNVGLLKQKTIILFDDPFRGLDPISSQDIYKLFQMLVEEGHTVVYTATD